MRKNILEAVFDNGSGLIFGLAEAFQKLAQ
jgi:hypothetical protein